MDDSAAYQLQAIAHIHSCYREKFGIPRQPGLVTAAEASLRFAPGFNQPDLVRGLEQFSHVWLIFVFHATAEAAWRPTVRPPRLGGNQRLGVLATRSMFRPNPLGLSVAELREIRYQDGQLELRLGGVDLLDGTPVLDIKPYLPYAERLESATAGFAMAEPERRPVVFAAQALQQCAAKQLQWQTDIRLLIEQILAQDPRPAYHQGGRMNGFTVCGCTTSMSAGGSGWECVRCWPAGGCSWRRTD
ncbi:MAG: tRNA (N6-threonylcarbamoyladenosine(37)-N6)-methyltransferase TrmO [Thiolinea sp.]